MPGRNCDPRLPSPSLDLHLTSRSWSELLTAAVGAALGGAALLDADAPTSLDSDAAALLHANASAVLDTAASLDADTAAFLNADSASLSDCAFHLPSMPSCRAAPSKAGAEA